MWPACTPETNSQYCPHNTLLMRKNFVALYQVTPRDYSTHHCWMKVHTIYHLKSFESAIIHQASNHIAHTDQLWKINSICGLRFICLSISSTRNLTFIASCIGSSLLVIWKEVLFCWLDSNFIIIVFFKSKARPLVLYHLFILSSAIKDLDQTSWIWGPEISMQVSFALNNSLDAIFNPNGKPLMYSKNSNGPRMEPWGTAT